MTQWEYLVVHIEGSTVAEDQPQIDAYLDADKYTEGLNRYGGAGWELVSFESKGNSARATFKRQKDGDPQKKAQSAAPLQTTPEHEGEQ